MLRQTASRPAVLALCAAALLLTTPHLLTAQSYFPGRHPDWERRTPEQLGLDAAAIQRAVNIAIAGESQSPRDLAFNHLSSFGREPLGDAVGPFTVRAPQTGLIVYRGYIVAEWGEPGKADNTFSVSKSFLSTSVGLAYDHGLIGDVHDLVGDYMPPIVLNDGDGEPGDENGRRAKLLFDSEHNRKITWNHLLRQTSDWEGTLWGKPEWADRPDRDASTWGTRPRNEPGTVYEYNDTRVNLLALAATAVWRRPLPEVLREYVMDPIGASTTWGWHGYENSWVHFDGRMIQSPSGGAHWGGGMILSAYDQARFGLFTMHRGNWNGEQLLSQDWFAMATAAGEVNTGTGFMNFSLNDARPGTWTHVGAGSNLIYVDPANDLVIVCRWIRGGAFNQVVNTVLEAIGGGY
ncbi:MAG: serine hydrolase [Gemmatimonadetes bacterium]|nr:serine hydrolase [Gemmatimonadota bacterium]MYD13231.1 serine hydrolase [Gemmatimonadota bacterium]MYI65449.1 serine hydrolase [Gemmatimonadota bacterium]